MTVNVEKNIYANCFLQLDIVTVWWRAAGGRGRLFFIYSVTQTLLMVIIFNNVFFVQN